MNHKEKKKNKVFKPQGVKTYLTQKLKQTQNTKNQHKIIF